jgi:MFS family permease
MLGLPEASTAMHERTWRVYPYRWVVLVVYMLIQLTMQTLWICFAPIIGVAAALYRVSDLQIGLIAMSFMIVYVPVSIPASWLIDKLGIRRAVGAGAVLAGAFGLLRGAPGAGYGWVLLWTVGIAIAQPLLLNSITTVAARWFPVRERATATGLALIANFLGTGIGQVASPPLTERLGVPGMLLVFGGGAAVAGAVFVLVVRDAPPTPPCPPGDEARALVLDRLGPVVRMPAMWSLLAVSLIGQGIFTGIATWIEDIVRPSGITPDQAGTLGGLLLAGAIVGAIGFSLASDRLRRRKPFLLLGVCCAAPSVAGAAWATSYAGYAAAFVALGIFLIGAAPILFQYAAEITVPAPEGTSSGLLNLAGQVSVVFVYAMQWLRGGDGSFALPLLVAAGLLAVSPALLVGLRESAVVATEGARGEPRG